jgi:hypothetical protein
MKTTLLFIAIPLLYVGAWAIHGDKIQAEKSVKPPSQVITEVQYSRVKKELGDREEVLKLQHDRIKELEGQLKEVMSAAITTSDNNRKLMDLVKTLRAQLKEARGI